MATFKTTYNQTTGQTVTVAVIEPIKTVATRETLRELRPLLIAPFILAAAIGSSLMLSDKSLESTAGENNQPTQPTLSLPK